MKNIIIPLMNDLHVSMQKKLAILWPKKGGWFPPEANITFEISKLASKYRYDVFGECDIGGGRADMILISTNDKWICHIECKLINSDTCKSGAIINDLVRLSKRDSIDYLLHNVNAAGTTSTLDSYDKFGLFVGGDISWMYLWWNSATDDKNSINNFLNNYPHSEKEKRIEELSEFAKRSSEWGVVPQKSEDGEYWLAYSLFQL